MIQKLLIATSPFQESRAAGFLRFDFAFLIFQIVRAAASHAPKQVPPLRVGDKRCNQEVIKL
jgi:hypothetical protein